MRREMLWTVALLAVISSSALYAQSDGGTKKYQWTDNELSSQPITARGAGGTEPAASATPQNSAESSTLQAMRSQLAQLQEQLRQMEANCSNQVQSQDVNATTRKRIVWMRESHARAMGLELWKDENGVTPRVAVAADTQVSGASVLSNGVPTTQFSAPTTFSAPTVLSTPTSAPTVLSAPVQTLSNGVVTYSSAPTFYSSGGAVAVQSTAALGMDNNPYLQQTMPYFRNSWVARDPLQAYETVRYHGTEASTTPNKDHPYVIYPWQARWSFR